MALSLRSFRTSLGSVARPKRSNFGRGTTIPATSGGRSNLASVKSGILANVAPAKLALPPTVSWLKLAEQGKSALISRPPSTTMFEAYMFVEFILAGENITGPVPNFAPSKTTSPVPNSAPENQT